jgi:hypothetical protein
MVVITGLVFLGSFMQSSIFAMESKNIKFIDIKGVVFKRTIKPSPSQYVCMLEHIVPLGIIKDKKGLPLILRSSIMFFIPNEKLAEKISALPYDMPEEQQAECMRKLQPDPMIAAASCPCAQYHLDRDERHCAIMFTMFKAVLDMLTGQGFRMVKMSEKLFESPLCFASFLGDPRPLFIKQKEDDEKIVIIRLPYYG